MRGYAWAEKKKRSREIPPRICFEGPPHRANFKRASLLTHLEETKFKEREREESAKKGEGPGEKGGEVWSYRRGRQNHGRILATFGKSQKDTRGRRGFKERRKKRKERKEVGRSGTWKGGTSRALSLFTRTRNAKIPSRGGK